MSARGEVVFVSSRAPWSSSSPLACLEALMTTAVFDVPAHIVLTGDRVFQLLPGQDGSELGSKNLSRMFGALGLYGIDTIHVEAAALSQRGLALDGLLPAGDCEARAHEQSGRASRIGLGRRGCAPAATAARA